jgi:single-strand DNA-binding protein
MSTPAKPLEPSRSTGLDHLNAFSGAALTALALLFVGIALGVLLAIWLRRRRLAWSWAALALAPAPLLAAALALADPSLIAPPLTLILATALAGLGWGLHAEIEDRRAGGDRETAAVNRRGPLDGVRRARRERPRSRPRLLGDGVPIGRTHRGQLAAVPRGSADSGRHILVPGATGAGKTTSLGALLVDYVSRSGFGAVVIEAKTDRALLEAARGAAASRGAAFHLFSPDGESAYDPLAHGSLDERSERLIAVEDWGSADADFYRQAASPFLRLVVSVLDASEEPTTLATVAARCHPDELVNLATAVGDPELLGEVTAAINALPGDQLRAVSGLRARLQNLASSQFARQWLDPGAAEASFDLRRVIAEREVAYFRLDTDRTGNVGRAIAQMVLLDLGAAASACMGEGVGTFVCVDEFGALEAPALERLFARARAAGFSVALGTQTLADLSAAGPAVRERIGATVSALVCHRIGEQADAEWIAQLIGAVPTWQTTIRTEGYARHTKEGTRTRGYRFEVNPSELQRLGTGEAYVARLDRSDASRARRVQVVPPWQRLQGEPPQMSFRSPMSPSPARKPPRPRLPRRRKENQMNSVSLAGALTKDPELKGSPESPVCRLRLVEANGHPDHPLYINVSVFGARASECAEQLVKGRRVTVVGKLRFREWERVDRSHRSEYWVAADRVDFLPAGRPAALEKEAAAPATP